MTKEKYEEFARKEKHYIDNELLLKFKEDVSKEKALEIISEKGASVIKFFKEKDIYHIKLRNNQTVEEAIIELSTDPRVLYAEPNYKVKILEGLPVSTEKEP